MMFAQETLSLLRAALPSPAFREPLGFTANERLSLDFLAQGEYNINFLLAGETRRAVLRYNVGSQIGKASNAQLEYEAAALKLVGPFENGSLENGLPGVGPRFITLLSYPVPLLVMEYLPGVPLDYADSRPIEAAAQTLARLHQIPIPVDAPFIRRTPCVDDVRETQGWLAAYFACERAPAEIKDALRHVLANAENRAEMDAALFPTPAHLVHTDVQAHNFIVHETPNNLPDAPSLSCRLVDWERPLIDDPTYDLAHFLIPTTTRWKCNYTFTASEEAAFLTAYFAARPALDPTNFTERLRIRRPYILLRALSWCAGAWVAYTQGDRLIAHRETLEKIEEYLRVETIEKLFGFVPFNGVSPLLNDGYVL